jgi:lipopolysaccharide biosynthesis protein/GT2 family glycosyltransferase
MSQNKSKTGRSRGAGSKHEPGTVLSAYLSPASFWPPQQASAETAWLEHAPFAFWLVEALCPRTLVELGTHAGYSYFAFCQAVQRLALDTRCYAVDTWKGDDQTGYYGEDVYQHVRDHHDQHFSSFSTLIRASFDEAIGYFCDASIDLLHIDGSHFYDQVRHDFEAWRPKLSNRCVVLFHDTNEREQTFGVFRLWEELSASHAHFEFLHGHGLGVLGVGTEMPASVARLFDATRDQAATAHIRDAYSRLGSAISLPLVSAQQKAELEKLTAYAKNLQRDLAARADALKHVSEEYAYLRKDLNQHQSALKQRMTEIQLLNKKLERTVKLQKELAHEQLQSERLRTDLTQAKDAIEEFKEGFARATVASEASYGQLQGLLAEGISLRSELRRRSDELAVLNSELERRLEQAEAMRSVLERRSEEAKALRSGLERRSEEAKALRSGLERRSEEAKAMRSELQRRSEQAAALCSELERRSEQAEALHSELKRRSREREVLKASLAQETIRSRELEAQLAHAIGKNKAILGSASWRITKPLRWIDAKAPKPARQVRRIIKLIWWTAIWQLAPRLRHIHARRDRLRGELELISSSDLFDRNWYLGSYPDVRAAGVDPALHYLNQGALEGRNPSERFDTQWYLDQNPDVAANGINPLVHYLRFGSAEGRLLYDIAPQPEAVDELELIASSVLLDRSWYLDRYPDVRASGTDPALHYLEQGASEGRNPSERFDTQWYLAQYPDVAAEGTNPLVHYLRYGAAEGRQPRDRELRSDRTDELELIASSELFDRNWYLDQYPDVRASGADPALQYLEQGASDGRSPSERFDTQWYLAHNPDVAAEGTNPLVHYLRYGAAEGRQPRDPELRSKRTDELELITSSELFDRSWYLDQYPDVRASGSDPALHYLEQGASEGRNPSETFDTQWYLAQYPDVAAEGINPLVHYLRRGAREGRQFNDRARQQERSDQVALIASSDLFDRSWYLEQYPDVRASGADPALHYLEQGASEGRNPSALFDTQWYLEQYPDVAAEGVNPLVHYLRVGAKEGRHTNATAEDVQRICSSGFFDRTWYLDQYPDVRATDADPALHYLERGASEGRDPSPVFDTRWYLAHYPDVAAKGVNPLVHYLRVGAKEGRRFNDTSRQGETIGQMRLIASSGLFDRDWYLDRYPDVRAIGVDPVLHYLEQGASEGRNPSRLFDTRWYLSHYRDLALAGWNPLVHYVLHGAAEERRPVPSAAGGPASADSSFIGEVTDVTLFCLKSPRPQGEIALVVTHSPDGRLKPHIRQYLAALQRQGIRVVLIVASDVPFEGKDAALFALLEGLYVRQNVGFDFAAWAHVLRDNPELFSVDVLYLINDSVIGPLNERKLEHVLQRLRISSSDAIGLTDNYERGWHLQSYFLALKPRALASDALRKFFLGVKNLSEKQHVINEYEVCLTPSLGAAEMSCEALFPASRSHNTSLLEWKNLITAGLPFVKIAALRDAISGGDDDWREVLQSEGFDPGLAEETLRAPTVAALSPIPRLAILLHAYYVDTIPLFQTYLTRIPFPFTLFISTDSEEKKGRIERDFVAWQNGRVEVRVMENRGRDIAPKIVGFRDVYDEYPYVLHVHTKKSSHSDDLGYWLKFLLDSLLGSPEAVIRIFQALRRPELGVIAPAVFAPSKPFMVWGPNLDICSSLARRMGFAIEPNSPLDFPAGSMFWARSRALRPLLELNLSLEDFPAEADQTDGTLAHAIERLYFYACELAGFCWTRDVLSSGTTLLPAATPRPLATLPISGENARKDVFRRRCREELARFLADDARLVLPTAAAPEVSVVVVLHNQAELTFATLRFLAGALEVPSEVIIVDNGSSDDTIELCTRIDGGRIVRNSENLHFLKGVNQGVAKARGDLLLLLNNDASVAPDAIRIARETLRAEADIGAVGGKLILLDGTLQEAGSIVWRDGTCFGYGRGRDPREAEFQFRRDVDYCSAAFLMTRRALFEELNGFDDAFAPAYYEETDFCMRLRAAGYRIVYEPRIQVSHFEFGSSPSSEAALERQRRNRALFERRHYETLQCAHLPPQSRPLEARMRGHHKGRILFIDDRVPFPSHGAGFPRTSHMLRAIYAEGWFVTFYPLRHPGDLWAETYDLLPRNIEVMADHGPYGLERFLRERVGYYDVLLVSRPHNMEVVQKALRAFPAFLERTRLIYDAEALIAPREALRLALENTPVDEVEQKQKLDHEIGLAAGASLLIAVNEYEADQFRTATSIPVHVIGHRLEPTPTISTFDARSDILFVGLLDHDGSPNVDSVAWFVREVMPKLDRLLGADYKLKLAGRNASNRIQSLAGPRVELLGQVDDLKSSYDAARLFIAPTRYAGGLPQKVHEAAAFGVPCVTTRLIARQLGWENEVELLAADAPKDFAAACARLYTDGKLWARLREEALKRVAQECNPGDFAARVAEMLAGLAPTVLQQVHGKTTALRRPLPRVDSNSRRSISQTGRVI